MRLAYHELAVPRAWPSAGTVTYADGGTVSHEYNRQRQRIQTTDQNGTVHRFDYDKLGRQTLDNVPTLGTGIDDAVVAIGNAYNVLNQATTISSLDGSGNVVNQVLRAYNGFQQLTGEFQEHDGAVNSTTPEVKYGYENGSANNIRPNLLTYPNGNALGYSYASGIDTNVSRVSALNWTDGATTAYTYIGLGTIVRADNQQPGVRCDLITGSTPNLYAGFDQFGRVIDCLWHRYSGTPADLDHFNYGYDQASNRVYRENIVAQTLDQHFDELYAYDGLYQLKDMQRGNLDLSDPPVIVTGTLAFHETWGLDQTGNWGSYTQDATGGGTPTLAQSRDANRTNEITEIANTTGPGWIVPQYDPAGNMTRLPQPLNPSAGYAATWDAWNRLVQLSDGGTIVAEFAYDGLIRRVSAIYATETRHFYYSADWQILEERLGNSPSTAEPDRQFVWGLRYVDNLILRDRTTGAGVLAERLYAMQDANWNVTALSDTSGAVQERYAYSTYGLVQFLDAGFTSLALSICLWETLYGGYRYAAAVGLYLARFRWLNSPLGCWLSKDPLGVRSDFNPFRYVANRPMVYTDPGGLRGPMPVLRPPVTIPPEEVEGTGWLEWLLEGFGDVAGEAVGGAGLLLGPLAGTAGGPGDELPPLPKPKPKPKPGPAGTGTGTGTDTIDCKKESCYCMCISPNPQKPGENTGPSPIGRMTPAQCKRYPYIHPEYSYCYCK